MSITMGLLKELERIQKEDKTRCTITNRATVVRLLRDGQKVVGCVWKNKDGKETEEYGPVVLCTGG